MTENPSSEMEMAEWPAEAIYLSSTSTPGPTVDPCIQREGLSEGSSSGNDSLGPGGQCWEELWTPNWQPTASHNPRYTTQLDNPDTFQHVHAIALEDTSSNFDTAITSTSLYEIKEASPTTLTHDLASFESENFEMWLKAFGASPNIEYSLIEPESSAIPLFPVGEIHRTVPGNSVGNDCYHADAVVHDSLPSSYLDLSNNTSCIMNVDSPSAPGPLPTTPGPDDFQKSNGPEKRYQLVRRLAPAAEAQFMASQNRNFNKDQLLVPATEPRKRRQCFGPLKREKVKQVRRLGACLRCRIYKEPVSSMLDILFVADCCPSVTKTRLVQDVYRKQKMSGCSSNPVIVNH